MKDLIIASLIMGFLCFPIFVISCIGALLSPAIVLGGSVIYYQTGTLYPAYEVFMNWVTSMEWGRIFHIGFVSGLVAFIIFFFIDLYREYFKGKRSNENNN